MIDPKLAWHPQQTPEMAFPGPHGDLGAVELAHREDNSPIVIADSALAFARDIVADPHRYAKELADWNELCLYVVALRNHFVTACHAIKPDLPLFSEPTPPEITRAP